MMSEKPSSTPDSEKRLWGLPHADVMYFDYDAVYELEIEPFLDSEALKPWIVEEWTVHPPEYHFPAPSTLIEWLIEGAMDGGEVGEGWGDNLESDNEEFIAKAEELISLIASKVRYRMADEKVAEHMFERVGHDIHFAGQLYRKDVFP